MDQYIFNEHDIKKVIFGYGAIRFSATGRVLSLIEIKPPVGPGGQVLTADGQKVGEWEDTGRRIDIMFKDFDEVKECERWLDQIEAGNLKSFVYKNVHFDFTKFHESALDLMRLGLKWVYLGICQLLAC
jgi:hypothetical protein